MYLVKQCYKNQDTKTQLQCYKYGSNNAISPFKQAKCYNDCPLENFKKFKQDHIFICQPSSQPASLSTGTDLEPIPLSI